MFGNNSGSKLNDRINCVFDGNSICMGNTLANNTLRYSSKVFVAMNTSFLSVQENLGVGGQRTSDMTDRQNAFLLPLYEPRCTRNLYCPMEVRNDLYLGQTTAISLQNMKDCCQGAKNMGFDVMLITQPPSNGTGGNLTGGSPTNRTWTQLETARQSIRTSLLADFPNSTAQALIFSAANGITYADFLCDIGGDATMGDVAQVGDTTLYSDTIHPTALGHTNMSTIIQRGITYYLTLVR